MQLTPCTQGAVHTCKPLQLAVDYTAEGWVEAVRAYTKGANVDLIFDPVGGEVGERSLGCLAWHGRYLVVELCSTLRRRGWGFGLCELDETCPLSLLQVAKERRGSPMLPREEQC